jgi:hypothetical protein
MQRASIVSGARSVGSAACDHTPVWCRRIHFAIADRRQRLDAEEEVVREATRPSIRQRIVNQLKERGEDNIH